MCWNKEISLVTFVLAIIGVIYLYKRNKQNDRWIAIFAAVVAMMQLAEYFMWSDLQCGSINKYASMFALLVLAFEPLMNMVGGICFSNTPYKNLLKYMLVAYLIFIAYVYFTNINNKQINWCGTSICSSGTSTINSFVENKLCNLQWYFTENMDKKIAIIWICFLMIPFLTMTPKYQGIMFFLLGFISFGIARIANNAAPSSLWCWLAIIVIYSKIFIY
jgi:hypothetical protein